MSKREDYQTRMGEQLALWDARFEALKVRAGKSPPAEIQKQLEQWQAASAATLAKLNQLKATTGDDWDAIKAETEKSWRAMEPALNERDPAAKEEVQAPRPH